MLSGGKRLIPILGFKIYGKSPTLKGNAKTIYISLKMAKMEIYAEKKNMKKAVLNSHKTPRVVSVGWVGLWKNNGVPSEFGKIRETGNMCHVMTIDE